MVLFPRRFSILLTSNTFPLMANSNFFGFCSTASPSISVDDKVDGSDEEEEEAKEEVPSFGDLSVVADDTDTTIAGSVEDEQPMC